MRIRVHDQKFEIFAGGKEVGTFDYRQAISKIGYICIWGDIELHRVSWEGRYYSMPFKTALPDGFGPGKILYVSGVVADKADKFAINFTTENGDVALHFNPRFGEKKVVRNTQTAGKWDSPEEREGAFPFQKGRTFDIIVQSQADGYYTFVDGQPFCDFKHRIPVNQVHSLSIEGDVELQGVHW